MKTIHLKCGHRISVRVWPSKTGLAKVQHHYKKFHPERMRKMTRKSLATKRRRGLINPKSFKHHPMYQRGKWDAISFAYVPDFRNEDEKMAWMMGFKDQKAKQAKKRGLINPLPKHFPGQATFAEEIVRRVRKGNLDTGISNLSTVGTHIAGWDYLGSVEKDTIVRIAKNILSRGLIKNRCNPKQSLPRRHAPLRLLKQYERDYLEKTLGKSWGLMPKSTIMRVLKKLKSLKSNPQPIVIYDKLLGIEARKGHGKFSGENFRHDFKHKTDAVVLGNPDGSLTIRSKKGKRLWKKFEY